MTRPHALVVVVELAESFSHFHLAHLFAPRALCGRRGRVARLLPATSWHGAPGPFPATFCARCDAHPSDRASQMSGLRTAIIARYSIENRTLDHIPGEVVRALQACAILRDRTPVGEGYVDLHVEIERERLRHERENDGCFLTDYMPTDYSREGALIYA